MRLYVLCGLAVCITLFIAPASSGRTTAGGPEWLPLKGTFKNAIGCTWNNGCNDPSAGYHGYPAIDFMVPRGTQLFAAGPGVVEVAYRGCADGSQCGPNKSGLGNSIAIRHDDGRYSWYGHLSEVTVEEGWTVKTGDLIGRTGSSGVSTGPHLHYEERATRFGGPIPPGPMLAYHGTRLVSYPGVLKFSDWNVVPCGKQPGESCTASHTVRNDGYTTQQASAPKPKPGVCAPQPMGVVFVLDDSGSNSETDPRYLRADAARVALGYLPAGTLVSAVNFASSAVTMLNTTRLTDANRDSIADQIRSSLRTGGNTNYESAFRQAVAELGRMRGVQRIVIFLSDGKPTSGYSTDRSIGAQRIPIHTVGYGPVRNLPVLIDIARNSGASYQPIENVAEASNAFATIVNPYQCNKAIGGANLTLKPNKEYKRSFNVARGAPGISALATWTHHDAPDVWLRRPDGTEIRAAAGLRPGERVSRPGQQVIRFDVSRPQSGRWTLLARSRQWVSLSFDAWRTSVAPVKTPLGRWASAPKGSHLSPEKQVRADIADMPAGCTNRSILLFRVRGSGEDYGTDRLGRWTHQAGEKLIRSGFLVRDMQAIYPAPDIPIDQFIVREELVKNYDRAQREFVSTVSGQLTAAYERCKQRRILIAGYSQGNIMLRYVVPSLPRAIRNQIAHVDLVADPTADERVDGALVFPPDLGGRPTERGAHTWFVASRQVGYPDDLARRVHGYCKKNDYICDFRKASIAGGLLRSAHSSYDFGAIGQYAADEALKRM